VTSLTTAGPSRDRRVKGAVAVPFTLSLIAGMVDVTSFLLLDGLFAAHVTGNVVVLAADVATGQPVRPAAVLAVFVFIAVTAVLSVTVERSCRAPYEWAGRFLWLQFALLSATAVAAVVLVPSTSGGSGVHLFIAVLALAAMACQNALLHLTFQRATSTAVMTGNIVASTVALVGMAVARRRGASPTSGSLPADSPGAAMSRWDADRAADRAAWLTLWPLLLGFVSGCVLGALASEVVDSWAWIAPALVGGMLATRVSRTGLPVVLRKGG
jgi:uncharacterized membrane protein YoaK (UPF0700 family)